VFKNPCAKNLSIFIVLLVNHFIVSFVTFQMEAEPFDWDDFGNAIRGIKELWDIFPQKETLNQEQVRNFDLVLFCLFDKLNRNDRSAASQQQALMLLQALFVCLRIIMRR
jgi:hypothetical protein